MRKMDKLVEINEEQYRVRKMDVFSASFLMKFLLEKFIPILNHINGILELMGSENDGGAGGTDEGRTEQMLEVASRVIPSILASVTDEDLKQLMTKCLNYADKSLPAGYQPVMLGDRFGVEGLEYDFATCVVLCFHTIALNCEGFFGEGGFQIGQLLKNMKPQDR